MDKEWIKYEDTARYLLNKVRDRLDLIDVEKKQKLTGNITGTSWEIDAKANTEDGVMLIECRRHTTKRIDQESVAAIAFRVIDTDSTGAILVSPLGLQEGAKKVAGAMNIISVTLNADCTPEEFSLRFLNRVFAGIKISGGGSINAKGIKNYYCKSCGELFAPINDELQCENCA